jgi:hypothetical protein
MFAASASASSRARPLGTTRWPGPLQRFPGAHRPPVRIISSALDWPTMRGRRTVPPPMSGTPTGDRTRRTSRPPRRRADRTRARARGRPRRRNRDGCDDGLGKDHPGWAHRTRAVGKDAVGPPGGGSDQVGASAEHPALPPQDGHVGVVVMLEGIEGSRQGVRSFCIDRISPLRARQHDGRDAMGLLDADGHSAIVDRFRYGARQPTRAVATTISSYSTLPWGPCVM